MSAQTSIVCTNMRRLRLAWRDSRAKMLLTCFGRKHAPDAEIERVIVMARLTLASRYLKRTQATNG
jgi:hypothetical protein